MINWFSARLQDNLVWENIIQQIALAKLDTDTQKNKSKLLPRSIHQSTQDLSIFKYENLQKKKIGVYHNVLEYGNEFFYYTKSTGKAGLLWQMLVISGCMSFLSTKYTS